MFRQRCRNFCMEKRKAEVRSRPPSQPFLVFCEPTASGFLCLSPRNESSSKFHFPWIPAKQAIQYGLDIPPDITQPPIRSNDEWGVHFWIGFSNTSYLLLSLDSRSDARGTNWGSGNSGLCQSVKHQVHADVCSGLYQSPLVWLILVRNVSSLETCRSYA